MSSLLLRSHTFAIIVILDLKIHQSMWIHWPFFPKTWTKGHWPLDDLWPHVCWGHMCDSTQGSLCPSPMTIHQCMWIQWSILQNTTYIHILHTYYILHTHTTYRMSDHIVSYWTQFRWDKNVLKSFSCSWSFLQCCMDSKIRRIWVELTSERVSWHEMCNVWSARYTKLNRNSILFVNLNLKCWNPR